MEQICYYCKHAYHAGCDMIGWTCELTDEKVESYDSCYNYDPSKDNEDDEED